MEKYVMWSYSLWFECVVYWYAVSFIQYVYIHNNNNKVSTLFQSIRKTGEDWMGLLWERKKYGKMEVKKERKKER